MKKFSKMTTSDLLSAEISVDFDFTTNVKIGGVKMGKGGGADGLSESLDSDYRYDNYSLGRSPKPPFSSCRFIGRLVSLSF
jgi:hypothetical protein